MKNLIMKHNLENYTGAKKLSRLFPLDNQLDTTISNNMKNLDIYLTHPNNKIIFSTLSEFNKKFGTDVQTNNIEDFLKV
jgi:hypothetical protein